MNDPNPYSPPTTNVVAQEVESDFGLSPKDLKKAKAIIKDANQFWLAIILCVVCTMVAALIFPIWYTFRLWQWNSLAKKYPVLVAPQSAEQLPTRFKSAQWKLIVGMIAGFLIFIGLLALLFLPAAF